MRSTHRVKSWNWTQFSLIIRKTGLIWSPVKIIKVLEPSGRLFTWINLQILKQEIKSLMIILSIVNVSTMVPPFVFLIEFFQQRTAIFPLGGPARDGRHRDKYIFILELLYLLVSVWISSQRRGDNFKGPTCCNARLFESCRFSAIVEKKK